MGQRTRDKAIIVMMGALMGGLMLGSPNQSTAAEIGRGPQGHAWQQEVEIHIDGSRLVTMPGERRNDDREREQGEKESGPSICHQASGTTWSTRDQKCPDSKPPERSQVWSTSPE
ncbi:hypothetical protein [Halomonas sp. PR-M31]|uniref:hypothetical protein n=1 Tax=Halomonas sp. PR-M31 TaxID=1471202 RepID=UPI0012E1FA69|nr:hypothetical protein [Halomonas sp. PR-M31]